MKILIVGSGGREHALAWRLGLEGIDVRVAPGNGGTPNAVAVAASDTAGLLDLAARERVELTIVGPEAPLAAGLVDAFAARGMAIFGPTQAAARLEWSKAWTKQFLGRHHIPTAGAEIVDSAAAARRAVSRFGIPVVLKADGLAGGKGVFVATTAAQVEAALEQLFGQHTLGAAADQVLIEEFLDGRELSVLAFSDGEHLAVMPAARDYKRLLDQDGGPNTGGMGGYTRPSYATVKLLDEIQGKILRPTLDGMVDEGHPYRGVLYAGLMLTADGPKVLEFNCRFGDPECQLILPLLASRLSEICAAVAAGAFAGIPVEWAAGRTYGVVLAAPGYPAGPLHLGEPIAGLDHLPLGTMAFHAGTRCDSEGRLVTAGGRVLSLVGSDREAVYAAAESVRFPGKQLRRDIGQEGTTDLPMRTVAAAGSAA